MKEQDNCVDYAQLWIEEQQLLTQLAATVPNDGTIVEIGTAQGGSACIFHRATCHRNVSVYSFDIAPSVRAYENLRDTGVKIIAESSTDGALRWRQTIGKPIDLLFIDGGHTLQNVFEDFNSWAPLLNPGGRIIFHDYDSLERGGLAHLGIHIGIDSILRCGLIDKPLHQYRLLSGIISRPQMTQLMGDTCYQTFAALAHRIISIRDADYSGWTIVDNGTYARLVMGCFKLNHHAETIPPERITAPNGKYIVAARPLAPALDKLRDSNISEDSIVALDSLSVCYLVAHTLNTNRDYLLTMAHSSNDFLRWEEILFMFNHATGRPLFPDELPKYSNAGDVMQLSHTIAHEQVRLAIISNLVKTIVDDTL